MTDPVISDTSFVSWPEYATLNAHLHLAGRVSELEYDSGVAAVRVSQVSLLLGDRLSALEDRVSQLMTMATHNVEIRNALEDDTKSRLAALEASMQEVMLRLLEASPGLGSGITASRCPAGEDAGNP